MIKRTMATTAIKYGVNPQEWKHMTEQQRCAAKHAFLKARRDAELNKHGVARGVWRNMTKRERHVIVHGPFKYLIDTESKNRPPGQIAPKRNTEMHAHWIKYCQHAHNTYKRVNWQDGTPILFKLTFEEWYTIWANSGKIAERGRRRNQYCMSRNNDYGNYEVGNVEIKTCEENYADRTRLFTKTGEQSKRVREYYANMTTEERAAYRLKRKQNKKEKEHVSKIFCSV